MPRFEDRHGQFWEIEQRELEVEHCLGLLAAGAGSGKARSRSYPTEEDARWELARQVARRQRRGFRWVGPSRQLAPAPEDRDADAAPVAVAAQPSWLALEEHFASGDDRFLGEVLASSAAGKLGALAEKWGKDARPWARRMLLAYIDDGCDRPHHKPLVKRLYKLVEAAGDDEAMAHFLVAFDRLGRRILRTLKESQYQGSTWVTVERWSLEQDPSLPGRLAVPGGGKPRESLLFSRATRRYLARRASRYFRQLGHRDVARYRRALCVALPLYRDRALGSAARLLDAWGLLHALYGHSPVLNRAPRGLRLAEGKSLGELAPAPQFAQAWTDAEAFSSLLALVAAAQSRTVRGWSAAILRRHHAAALAELGLAELRPLIGSPHEEAMRLGIELLPRLGGLELLPVGDWLELLAIEHLDALAEIARLAEQVIAPARLTLAQCLALAGAKAAAVAMLGLGWARGKPVGSAGELRAVLALASSGVAGVRAAAARWALELLATHPAATLEHLRDLCDAPHRDVRELALAAIAASVAGDAALARAAADPTLWFALTESPYDDVRAFVLAHAARWRDEAPPDSLRRLWTTAILAVHRGSAAKARVPRQIAERLAAHPEEAPALLPVLGLALRSVRPAERALALGALARALRADAALGELAQRLLPELTLSNQVVL